MEKSHKHPRFSAAAAALRENLKRRKAQARGRKAPDTTAFQPENAAFEAETSPLEKPETSGK